MDIKEFFRPKNIEQSNDVNEDVVKDNSQQNKKRKISVINDSNKKEKKSKEEKIMGEVEKTVDLYKKFLERNIYKKQCIRYSRKQLDEELKYINENGEHYIRHQLINVYLLTNNGVCKIIRNLEYTNPPLLLRDIEKEPFSFITFEYQLITFEKAIKIRNYNYLTISDEVIKEAWIIDNFIKKNNALYIKKSKLEKQYKVFCKEYNFQETLLTHIRCIENKTINNEIYYTTEYFINMEKELGDLLLNLFNENNKIYTVEENIDNYKSSTTVISGTRDHLQVLGVQCLIEHRFAILTGGPGTGKSTCIVDAIEYGNINHCEICVCAPTGKAYKELYNKISDQNNEKESHIKLNKKLTGTLHKMTLDIFKKISNKIQEVGYDEDALSEEDITIPKLIILDEASMVDIFMFKKLLYFVEIFNCRLWLIGDPDQLPPIGPGEPFKNIITYLENTKFGCEDEDDTPIIKLEKNYRSKEIPDVIEILDKMKVGGTENLIDIDDLRECQNIEWEEIDENAENIDDIILNLLEKHNYNHEDNETIIMTAEKKHSCGHINLNKLVQQKYNKNSIQHKFKFYGTFKEGDRVVRTENDYTGDNIRVNGDQAKITEINEYKDYIEIRYDNDDEIDLQTQSKHEERIKIKDFPEIFKLFYATTVHKMQGTGKEKALLFMPLNHWQWRDNKQSWTLLYTAISRIKKKLIIIGATSQFVKAQSRNRKDNSKPSIFMKEFIEYQISKC